MIKIGKLKISNKSPCAIIAEISANHMGSLNNAKKLISAAKNVGADAVKIQCYDANDMTLNTNKKDFRIKKNSPWSNYKNYWNLYDKASTPSDWVAPLIKHANKIGIEIFASIFSEEKVQLMEKLGINAYKIASPELNHIPLIKKISETNKPIIISTGLAEKGDIESCLKNVKKKFLKNIIILKCTSIYPAPLNELNLKDLIHYKKKYKNIVGLSDHSLSNIPSIIAVSYGAKIIEKHLVLNKNKKTPDSFFSLTPKQFKNLISNIRDAEKCIQNNPISTSLKKNMINKRSIYVSKNINKLEKISEQNIKVVRPNHGIHPKYYSKILGKKVNRRILFGERLNFNDIK
jgi:pseudaminic acid synthase